MKPHPDRFLPPFCPASTCAFHVDPTGWRFKRKGFFVRQLAPQRIQRFLCLHCNRSFSSQTFATSYWLKRPDVLRQLAMRLVGCAGFRQIARDLGVSPSTVLGQTARLGRHCLLFHEQLRPRHALGEALAIDGFETFEFSQYTPVHFNLAIGASSHFFYAFTDAELRRKGRMTQAQRERRAELERLHGRPDPRAIEREMAELLSLLARPNARLEILSDEHPDYPRALRRLSNLHVVHRTVSSRVARTPANPLFPVNLTDLLIRHSSANHKRETIAFSKRRQSAAERLFVFTVWRNYMKSFSERRRDATPAQRLAILSRRLSASDVLERRLFVSRSALAERLLRNYRRATPTRRIANATEHRKRYAD